MQMICFFEKFLHILAFAVKRVQEFASIVVPPNSLFMLISFSVLCRCLYNNVKTTIFIAFMYRL